MHLGCYKCIAVQGRSARYQCELRSKGPELTKCKPKSKYMHRLIKAISDSS